MHNVTMEHYSVVLFHLQGIQSGDIPTLAKDVEYKDASSALSSTAAPDHVFTEVGVERFSGGWLNYSDSVLVQ